MIIPNTLFQKPKNRYMYWTWESPDGETRNQIDFTLSSQRGIVTNCQVITKADIGSYHRLAGMTLRINKRLSKLKTIKKQKPFNVNTQKLRGMKKISEINLKKKKKQKTPRFEKLEEEVTARSFSEIMKEEASRLAGKTEDETPALSTEDQEIKQLEDKIEGRQVRERENRVHRTEQNDEKETQTKITKETDRSC